MNTSTATTAPAWARATRRAGRASSPSSCSRAASNPNRGRRPGCLKGMTRGYSAVVLAGGDGTRLRSLTWQLAGDDRPKQICHLLRSEEHTSELQSQSNLVCRLLLEK